MARVEASRDREEAAERHFDAVATLSWLLEVEEDLAC